MFASAWLTDPFRNIYRTQRPSVNAPTIHPENAPARAAVSPGGAAAGSRQTKQCPTPSSIKEVQLKTTGGTATRLSKTMAMGKGDNVKLWQGWTAKRCSGKVRQSLEKASMQPPRLNFVTCTPEEGSRPYAPTETPCPRKHDRKRTAPTRLAISTYFCFHALGMFCATTA